MQVLDLATVKQQLTMPMAIEAIEDLLKVQHSHPNWVKTPERLVIPTYKDSDAHQTGSHLSMPSVVYDGTDEYAVVKLVTICPDNPKQDKPTTVATITVSDTATGDTLAFMDGIYVTQVRTAALSGVATKYLANPESQTVAVVGTGGMAYEQLNAVLTVCPNIKQVNLWNRTEETAHTFKQNFERDYPQWDVSITVCDTMQAAIKEADVINLATRATEGLFEADDIKPDAHINAVGAYQSHMKEVSDSVIEACAYVVIDDLAGGKHEAGDLIQADDSAACSWTWDELSGELIDLVSGELEIGNRSGMTLFKSVGAASFDAAVALKVAQLAVDKNLGETAKI
ncbi:ornithine cyclodeaminase family protein [Psychrobacter sp. FDAARGOS_221]|uniref:ornithine cyclodeaminase family protein n=1 Tax=Psychrobacter sp. FDAARGOS_221 TaxID=1975705 RepID=UPI000BB550CB|nr:ornithine cyclodeaminase [Psychrobacter sp. FDAARGOS_221]PNK60974.1 ornithine cyclodeaminase [Psychrobacter sp. FDAARGOS_221]